MSFVDTFEFYTPKKILFGAGTVEQLGDEVKRFNADRVLVVTDQGVVGAGLLDRITGILKAASIDSVVYDKVVANPTMPSIHEGGDLYTSEKCNAIIGLGGGSPMDAAKAIGVKATHDGNIIDYTRRGGKPLQDITPPLITIATTSGTASEVTRFSVLTNVEEKIKMVIADPIIISDVAIVDPVLTQTLPPAITASTGMDALTHAVESYISFKGTILTAPMALEAIELIGSNLRQAVANGNNMEARTNMALGSMMAGMAFGNSSVGAVHGMAHALGGFFNIAHGVANAMMLPYVMQYCIIACPDRFGDIAAALGENLEGLTEMEAAQAAVDAVEALSDNVGIPKNLKDVGADPAMMKELVNESVAQGAFPMSPRVPTPEHTQQMFEAAFEA